MKCSEARSFRLVLLGTHEQTKRRQIHLLALFQVAQNSEDTTLILQCGKCIESFGGPKKKRICDRVLVPCTFRRYQTPFYAQSQPNFSQIAPGSFKKFPVLVPLSARKMVLWHRYDVAHPPLRTTLSVFPRAAVPNYHQVVLDVLVGVLGTKTQQRGSETLS